MLYEVITILFKGGEHLEQTHRIDAIILDKTGTVTKGKPELTDVLTERNEAEFLRLVGAAEKNSEHPLAEAIVEGVKAKNIDLPGTDSFEAIPGFGIKAVVEGNDILMGTRRLMDKFDVDATDAYASMSKLEESGKTAMLVAINNEYAGMVAVADTIKESSAAAVITSYSIHYTKLYDCAIRLRWPTADCSKSAVRLSNYSTSHCSQSCSH